MEHVHNGLAFKEYSIDKYYNPKQLSSKKRAKLCVVPTGQTD